jgi:hypothetical protein
LPPPTQVPPTQPPPTPESTEPSDAIVPVFGDTQGLEGYVTLPGFSPPAPDPLVFTTELVFQQVVYDPDEGNADGDGIETVTFAITEDDTGETVHNRTEDAVRYCVFGGGEPDCTVLDFADANFTWPDGLPINNGFHTAEISVDAEDPDKDGASWRFTFEIQLPNP